jgi:hypothetical protein
MSGYGARSAGLRKASLNKVLSLSGVWDERLSNALFPTLGGKLIFHCPEIFLQTAFSRSDEFLKAFRQKKGFFFIYSLDIYGNSDTLD